MRETREDRTEKTDWFSGEDRDVLGHALHKFRIRQEATRKETDDIIERSMESSASIGDFEAPLLLPRLMFPDSNWHERQAILESEESGSRRNLKKKRKDGKRYSY